jgi:phage repressor protein C with HTH and peptisase S24 domain
MFAIKHDCDVLCNTNVIWTRATITYVQTLAERLKAAREAEGLSQEQLAKDAGVAQSTIGNIEAGTRPRPATLPQIAARLHRRAEWLRTGKGPEFDLPHSIATLDDVTGIAAGQVIDLDAVPGLTEVPRVRFKLSAGVSGYAIEHEQGNGKPIYFRQDWFTVHGYRPERLFAVRVSGASMEPTLWDGDLVVVNTDSTEPRDGVAFALNYEGELVIKRLRRDAGQWYATSDSADQRRFAPKLCTPDVQLVGEVIYKQSERV